MSKVMHMDKLARQALLYDFYGELLTEHQRRDLVKRSTKTLNDYEEKLHLVERFVSIREKVGEIHQLTQNYEGKDIAAVMAAVETISYQILEEL